MPKGQCVGNIHCMQDIARFLGLNIEKLRIKRSLTQAQLARLAAIPRSTLTNIESGSGNPSLQNLLKISQALGVSVEELLSKPRTDVKLIEAKDVKSQTRSSVKVYKLMPDRIRGIELDRMEFPPGGVFGGQPHLVGTKEYFSTLQGEIQVHVAGESFVVKAGDVLAFAGNQAHSYRNSGRGVAVGVSLVIPMQ